MASNLVYMLVAALFFIVNTQFCYGGQQQDPSTSSSVVVHGKVFCNTCSNPGALDSSYFIPGASVAVECFLNRKIATSVRVEGGTDEMGEFKIEIPSLLHSKPERCSAQLIRSPHASCNVPSIATSSNFILTADLDRVRTYSAGSLSYRPRIVPSICYTKDSDSDIVFVHGREALEKDETSKVTGSSPTLADLPIPPGLVPPLPNLPIPPGLIPPLPNLPIPPGLVPPLPNLPIPPGLIPPLPNLPIPPGLVPPLPNLPIPPGLVPPLPNLPIPPGLIPPIPGTPPLP